MDFDLNSFASKLGAAESGNDYENKNNPRAYGRYQFTSGRLDDLKNKYSLPEWYNVDYFDAHPSSQDLYFSYHIQDITDYIYNNSLNDFEGMAIIAHNGHLAKINIYGLIAGAHLGGNTGLKNYLVNKYDANDGNKYVSDYVADFSNMFPENVPVSTNKNLWPLLFGGLIITGFIIRNEAK